MDEDEDPVNDQDEDQGGPAEEQPDQPHEDFDAAHEMDATTEEGEFARFLHDALYRCICCQHRSIKTATQTCLSCSC